MGDTTDVAMSDVNPRSPDSNALENEHGEQATGKEKEEDELAGQYEIVHLEMRGSSVEAKQCPRPNQATPQTQLQVRKDTTRELQPQESGTGNIQEQVEEIRKELMELKSQKHESESKPRLANNDNGSKAPERVEFSEKGRQWYQQQIQDLKNAKIQAEEQVHSLLNTQEAMDERLRATVAHFEREKKAREEAELNLRSEIATIQGQCRREKERAQNLMKAMAEMQNADPLKLDNTYFKSSVEGLRCEIKNWARNQRLVLSLPAHRLSSYVNRVMGEKGPKYDFLRSVTPNFQEYTESRGDFKWLLQAYIWQRLVELIFRDDLWIGTRKSLNDDDNEYRIPLGYRWMKSRLDPGENSTKEYVAQFHEWRSNTSRILDKKISQERRKRTVEMIRDDIINPLTDASEPAEQDIDVGDLEDIIESAMRLAASMAQQRAYYIFEFIPAPSYGNTEFNPHMMVDPYPPEKFEHRYQFRAVSLTLAPRLLKYGTSEGTNLDSCTQLLEFEVETRIAQRRFSRRTMAE